MRRAAGVALLVVAAAAIATALTSPPAGNAPPTTPGVRLDGEPTVHRGHAPNRAPGRPNRPADPSTPQPTEPARDDVTSSESASRHVIHGSGNIVVVSGEVEEGEEGEDSRYSGSVTRNGRR